MEDTQLARAVAELGGLTRQLGYGAEVVVACCDAAVHDVSKVFTRRAGGAVRRWRHRHRRRPALVHRAAAAPIDLLVVVTDCHTPWPERAPPFPVITIRVGDGAPPPWGERGANKVITIEEPASYRTQVPDSVSDGRSMSPWNRRPLTIPPNSLHAWLRLAVWELWMGMLVCGILGFGALLIVTAPDRIVTVRSHRLTIVYGPPPRADSAVRTASSIGAAR